MAEDTQVTDQQTHDAPPPSDQDSAGASASGVDETAQASQDSDEAADATDDTADDDLPATLLSEAERDAINAIQDLDKRERAFNKAWTQKTQRVSNIRKELERDRDLLRALKTDTKGTLKQLTQQVGLEVRDVQADTTAATTAGATDRVTALIKARLGPEYEDIADRLGPAIAEAAKAVAEEQTKPILENQEALIRDSAERESEAVLAAFGQTHPDWKKHESKMLELSKQIQPAMVDGKPTMTETQFLDLLYRVATQDVQVGERTKKVVERMVKSAGAASRDAGGVTADKVAERSTGPITFDEAARLARQGVALE